MGMLSRPAVFSDSRCDEGGTPVIGSSLVFSWSMDHAGVIRRSDEALSDTTMRGTSASVVMVGCFPSEMRVRSDVDGAESIQGLLAEVRVISVGVERTGISECVVEQANFGVPAS